jgi:hypothetical protein
MTEVNENPCSQGLTPQCFQTFPLWAKRALFLRLLYLLLPFEITSKLPGIFRLPFYFQGPLFPPTWLPGDPSPEGAFIPPDTVFPPGWLFGDPWPEGVFLWLPFTPPASLDLLEGIIIPPGTEFPPDWQSGDPLPPGVTIEIGGSFPPGWQPGDPPPPGITIQIGGSFPPGWQPGDPLPPGIIVDIAGLFPPGWQPGDPTPPGVIIPPGTEFPPGWQPGDPLPDGVLPAPSLDEDAKDTGPLPINPLTPFNFYPLSPVANRAIKGVYTFFDNFTILDTAEWYKTISQNGTIEIVDEQLRMVKSSDTGFVSYTRADPKALLRLFSVSFDLRFISGTSTLRFDYWTGTYYLYILFQLPDSLKIWDGTDWTSFTLTDFTNIENSWRFWISTFGCRVFRNSVHVATAQTIALDDFASGTHRFVLADTGDVRIDNFYLRGF